MVKRTLTSVSLLLLSVTITLGQGRPIWTRQKANEWYKNYAWQRGCNFIPHNAINQLEMWQAGTFDTTAIDHDLTLAESVGFNCMRVFLHHVAWQ
ncbi:MAG: 1,4-beta-xylanase, partial [Bacteroidota bacterium]